MRKDQKAESFLAASGEKFIRMAGLNSWHMRRKMSIIARRLARIYMKHPEDAMRSRLAETSWSYREWAFFYAAKGVSEHLVDSSELAIVAQASEGDFRDFLLLFSIRADPETRKAIFLSRESFKRLLTTVVEVVLESAPREFRSDNWLDMHLDAGVESFKKLYPAE